MFARVICGEGLLLQVIVDGKAVSFEEWKKNDNCIYYMPLSVLVDNGNAAITEQGCLVPFESIYLLDNVDRIILGIPSWYRYQLMLRGNGMLNDSDFQYDLKYCSDAPDGGLLSFKREGNVLVSDNAEFLLSESQYELIRLVEYFNIQEQEIKTPDYNFKTFALIKQLAKVANCFLDSYLENENIYFPEKIKIEVGRDDQGFTIEPSLNIAENEIFQESFEKYKKIPPIYPLSRENGERLRVVLDPKQREALLKLKETGGKHKTREQIAEIIEKPTDYFDPELFNLNDLYSDRVVEIGIYKPKFYPFVCPYKSCWISGATIETPENGTAEVFLRNYDELNELRLCIAKAELQGKTVVEYKGALIDIEDARALCDLAERQFRSPNKPIEIEKEGRKVLIIKENDEELDYSETSDNLKKERQYTLYEDLSLNERFPLKEHQREGVAWFQYLFNNSARGCLMADDMGLGKTLQVLYFIDWHYRTHVNHKPYLIVTPVSLLENWENEYNKFFNEPRLSVKKVTSKDIPHYFDAECVRRLQEMDIILTNYETLRIAQLNFCAVEFDVVALDEAQRIKSPGTMVTSAAKALKGNFKIAMTGTPVENTLLDLWCIMDFCVPGLLGTARSFASMYQSPLKDSDVDVAALGNEVHDRLGRYFLRRLKEDAVKELPSKHEVKQTVKMPLVQEQLYQQVVSDYLSGCQPNMLVTIMKMREVSEHPYLLDGTLQDHAPDELIEDSARLEATIKLLDDIKENGEKVIIFTERKEIQKMLQQICHYRYGLVPMIINGDTPTMVVRTCTDNLSRQKSIDRFQATIGFNVIIMSPVAAGMGLNVTAANHVIHYSRHWNPAKENQATDRAYRIGQTKDVFVYYPMAVSDKFKSFDETLDELLSRKSHLASSTIFPTERVEVKQDELSHLLFN